VSSCQGDIRHNLMVQYRFLAPGTMERHQLSGSSHPASFSTVAQSSENTPSIFTSPLGWWRKRQEGQEMEKYKTRLAAMAEKDTWTVGDLVAELDEVVNSWKSKMPGVSNLKETEMAKKLHKTLNGIINVAGKNANDEVLDKMTRRDKLQAAIEGETTVEEINTAIDQFRIMALMQKVVRQRKLSGKSIPSTPEGVQALVQAHGSKMLSKAQKSKMGKEQARKIMRRR
jgi:hypothetical protein